jgi:hypothetical protein
VYLSRVSIENLIAQVISDEKLKQIFTFDSFKMNVDKLDDIIDGFSNTFDED